MDVEHLRPTRAEIDLGNLEHNFKQIRRIISPKAKICAVVKAEAYGHGAFEVAQSLISCGVFCLSVAVIDEAIELRQNGIKAPILILGFTPEDQFDKIIEHDIIQTVYSTKSARILSEAAANKGKKVKVHIKLDTGFNRIGYQLDDSSLNEIKKLFELKNLQIEGIYTHFARADEADNVFTMEQFRKFMTIVDILEGDGFDIPIRHTANSAAIIEFPYTHLDMVRPGIILYGLYPSEKINTSRINLKPVMSVKTKVSNIKTLPKGKSINSFITNRQSIIATLPVGYADGYSRRLSNKAEVLINGQRVPVVGRICIDECMVDVTDITSGVQVGDDAVLFGSMGNQVISVEELAMKMGTINYEVICAISMRVPRIYIKDGKIIKV
jgi:alanine racemase